MNVRQQKFIDYYIECGDAGAAYLKAGYKAKNQNTRDVCACNLLRNVRTEILSRMDEIAKAGRIRVESKRLLLWEIAQKASGRILTDPDDETFQPDYKAAIAAINELNRMDGHHQGEKLKLRNGGFVFDAEILPPEDAEICSENEQKIPNFPITTGN